MSGYHLAEINVGRLRAPVDHPMIADFVANKVMPKVAEAMAHSAALGQRFCRRLGARGAC